MAFVEFKIPRQNSLRPSRLVREEQDKYLAKPDILYGDPAFLNKDFSEDEDTLSTGLSEQEKQFIDEEFEKLFKQAEEYKPVPIRKIEHPAPLYVPTKIGTPDFRGPKPRNIEQYKWKKVSKEQDIEATIPKKRRPRGGRKTKLKRERAELHRIIRISVGEQKQRLQQKLLDLKPERRYWDQNG